MTRWQLTGLFLWRGGLAFAAAAGFYYGAWNTVKMLDLPTQLNVGLATGVTGIAFVMLSLILERIEDSKKDVPWSD